MRTSSVWKNIQRKVGATPDGQPGPMTANAIAAHLGIQGVAEASQWPKDNTASLIEFYGEPGSNQSRCHLPYEMVLDWDESTTLSSFACHSRCVSTFEAIFRDVFEHYGEPEIKRLGLNRFGGCLNVRKKRGGTTWSVHAFGAAVDLWPSKNRLRWGADRAEFAKPDYETFWSIVESHGAVSLGRERNFDYMHFQLARL